jgi:rhamnulokinase
MAAAGFCTADRERLVPQPTIGDSKNASGQEWTHGRALVAIDLGAESCRTSLLRWVDKKPQIRMVHRFPNSPVREGATLRWDIQKIVDGVMEGLHRCAELATEGIAALGADGWAVDYVRLNPQGKPLANPFCYRDERNLEAQKQLHARISPERLYQLTGIQILSINTLYQLFADGSSGIPKGTPWTNLPEYLLSCLGGKRVSEYTNATHTQMIGASERTWCNEILEASGLDINAAPPLVQPGAQIGNISGPLALLPAFRDTRLIAPASHDTASAIAGIPAQGNDWAFISSGTWSLVGTVLDAPCISDAAREKNFSNEGGVGGKIYFLKNVNAMWLLRQCIEQWQSEGRTWTTEELIDLAAKLPAPENLLDVDDPELIPPGDMPVRINAQLSRAGKPPISKSSADAPQMANLIFHSLAQRYAAVVRNLESITGKQFRRLYIVGGGSKNQYLNRLTAQATGLEVALGSTESTTIGNFAIQLASLAGEFSAKTGVTSDAVAQWASILFDSSEA